MGTYSTTDVGTATIGLIGVVIGGILTTLSQSLARRAERLRQLKEEVAGTIALSHMIRSSLDSLHGDQKDDQDARTVYAEALTRDTPEFYKKCQMLLVIGSSSVRMASKKLATDGTALIKYAHPEVGDGASDEYKDLDERASQLGFSEDTLAGVVRSYWWLRWPYILWRRNAAHRHIAPNRATPRSKLTGSSR